MTYTLIQSITESDLSSNLASNVNFGIHVAISSDGLTVAGSAHKHLNGRGSAFVLRWDTDNEEYQQIGGRIEGVSDSHTNNGRLKDIALSSDGNKIACGCDLVDTESYTSNNSFREGAVKVVEYSNNSWSTVGSVLYPLNSKIDQYGNMVDLAGDGSKVFVGARYTDSLTGIGGDQNHINNGSVTALEYSSNSWSIIGENSWSTSDNSIQIAAPDGISLVGENVNDLMGFGLACSTNGTRIAVCITGFDGSGTDRSSVRVYDYSSSTDKFLQIGQSIVGVNDRENTKELDISGDGTTVLFARRGHQSSTSYGGYASSYEYDSASSLWVLRGSDNEWSTTNLGGGRLPHSHSSDGDARTVSLSNNGTITAVGHSVDGQVNVYQWDSSQFSRLAQLSVSSINFGISIMLSQHGDYIVVGASTYSSGVSSGSGAIYVYYNSDLTPSGDDEPELATGVDGIRVTSTSALRLKNDGFLRCT